MISNECGAFFSAYNPSIDIGPVCRSGEVGFAAAELGYFLHEMNQAVIAGQHESIDQDSRAAAAAHFFERLRHYERIKSKRVFVNAAVFQRQRGGFSVRDHDDLPHIFFLAGENALRKTQPSRVFV